MIIAEMAVRFVAETERLAAGIDAAEVQVKGFADSMDKIGSQMTDVGTAATVGLTAPILAAGTAMAGAAIRVGGLADELLDLVDQTGLTAETLQEFRHVALVAGVGPDTLANAAIKLTTAMSSSGEESANLSGALAELGIKSTDATGELRDMDDLLPDIIRGLQNTSDTTKRNAVAADIFGRSWAELAPILSLGAEEMDAARRDARELGLVLSGEALEGADEFRVVIDTLQARIGAAVSKFGLIVIEITKLPAPLLASVAAVAGLVAAIGPLLVVAGTLASSIAKLAPFFPILKAGFAGLAGPIALAVVAFASVVAAGTAVIQHWNVISFETQRLIDFIQEQFARLLPIFKVVKEGTEMVTGFFKDMFNVIVGRSIVPDMIAEIGDNFKQLDPLMVKAAQRAADRVNLAFKNIVNPEALRSLDFNVTMNAETLYANVIAGGKVAGETLRTMAVRTEIATALSDKWSAQLGDNITRAAALAEEHRRMEAAERKVQEQALTMAQVVGLVPLPVREMVDTVRLTQSSMSSLEPEIRNLEVSTRTAINTSDQASEQLNIFSTAADAAKGFLGGLGQEALSVVGKFTPMGIATQVIGELMRELSPALEAVTPLISILARMLSAGIMPILEFLFPIIKFVAIALTFLLEIIYRVAQGFLLVIGHVVRTIGKLIDALPFVSGAGIIRAGENLLNSADAMGDAAAALSEQRDEIRALEWPKGEEAIEEAAAASDRTTEAVEENVAVSEETLVAIREEAGVLTKILEAAIEIALHTNQTTEAVKDLEITTTLVSSAAGPGAPGTQGSNGAEQLDFQERVSGSVAV